MAEENIISTRSIDGTTPICIVILLPLTKRESIGERRDRRQKKMHAGRKRNFLKQCKKGCLAKFARLEWRSLI